MGDANSISKTFGCRQVLSNRSVRAPLADVVPPLKPSARTPLIRHMKRQTIGDDQPQIVKSTLQAVEYLIKQNDPARLRAFLAKHTRTERIAIKRQLQRNST
jgi:3-deoxy-D-arabino-heptulosonate 7-phosphate (DAHP) synthase class II